MIPRQPVESLHVIVLGRGKPLSSRKISLGGSRTVYERRSIVWRAQILLNFIAPWPELLTLPHNALRSQPPSQRLEQQNDEGRDRRSLQKIRSYLWRGKLSEVFPYDIELWIIHAWLTPELPTNILNVAIQTKIGRTASTLRSNIVVRLICNSRCFTYFTASKNGLFITLYVYAGCPFRLLSTLSAASISASVVPPAPRLKNKGKE